MGEETIETSFEWPTTMQPAFSYHEVTEKPTLIEMLPWGFGSIQCGFKSFASGLGLKAIPVDVIQAKNNYLGLCAFLNAGFFCIFSYLQLR